MPCRQQRVYVTVVAIVNWNGGWYRCTDQMRPKPDSIVVQNAAIHGEGQIDGNLEEYFQNSLFGYFNL